MSNTEEIVVESQKETKTIFIGEEIQEKDIFCQEGILEAYQKCFIKSSKKKITMEFVGEGSTSQAWQVIDGAGSLKGKIVKTLKEKLTEDIKNDCIKGFLRQSKIIEILNNSYQKEQNYIMLHHPILYKSSKGPVLISDATATTKNQNVNGATVENMVAAGPLLSCKQRMINALQLAWKISDDIRVYHNKKIIHFDVKPANILLIPVGSDKKDFAVRNLDFGSCVFTKDILDELKRIKDNKEIDSEYLIRSEIEQMRQKICRSSTLFYPTARVQRYMEECLNCSTDEEMEKVLFALDVLAVKKIIGCYYYGAEKTSKKRQEQLRKEWLTNERWSKEEDRLPKTMEDYNIFYSFWHLAEPTVQKGIESIEEFRKKIRFLLACLGVVEDDERPVPGEWLNRNFVEFDYLLDKDRNRDLEKDLETKIETKKGEKTLNEAIQNASINPMELITALKLGE